MPLALIKTEIKTKLEAISGVENVYDYKRFCSDWATYKDLFVKDSKVNTWEIERKSFSRTGRGGSGAIEDITHDFIIRGFYSFFDAYTSEKTFQNLVETICADFINDPTLGGKAQMVEMPITGTFSTGKLGEVLTHIVEISLSVKDRII